MFQSRRQFIKKILSLGAYGCTITNAFLYSSFSYAQWISEKFSPGSYQQILTRLFADADFIDSKKITFSRLPRIAENGATVPITVDSKLDKVSRIFILVENNPHPLIAEFVLSSAVKPHVSARLKMAKDSDVIVIVEAEGKLYRKKQHVKVTVGGCG